MLGGILTAPMPLSQTPPTPESLLEHLEWVRRLARGLVADPNAADDLVQEAWLSAARRPPQGGNLRSWLATVVRNAARERGRKDARRTRHEARAARVDEVASSTELADRVSMQQAVVQRVLELDEPYRETVLLRYFQELTPGEIAARMAVPVATAKTRLRRALADLRTRLDRDSGGDRHTWMSALMPLARVTETLGTGALIHMSTKTIAWTAAAVVVAVLLPSLFLSERHTRTGAGEAADTPRAALAGAPERIGAQMSAESSQGNRSGDSGVTAVRVAQAEPPVQRVIVVDAATGTPVANADVWTMPMDYDVWLDRATNREEHLRAQGIRHPVGVFGLHIECIGLRRSTRHPEQDA
jgi:RNA polymerase sigma-70 factor (ECF subfamily)